MSSVLSVVSDVKGLYLAHCPGCKMPHQIHTKQSNPNGANWTFNGDMEKPTFSPSLLVTYRWGEKRDNNVCHSFIRNGVWEFLNDCTHELAGKKVPMTLIENVKYD